jgi:hypothetical protein
VEEEVEAVLSDIGRLVLGKTATRADLLRMRDICVRGDYAQADVLRMMGMKRIDLLKHTQRTSIGISWKSLWKIDGRVKYVLKGEPGYREGVDVFNGEGARPEDVPGTEQPVQQLSMTALVGELESVRGNPIQAMLVGGSELGTGDVPANQSPRLVEAVEEVMPVPMVPRLALRRAQANAARWAKLVKHERTRRICEQARNARLDRELMELRAEVARKDWASRWAADYDPAVVDIIGTAFRNKDHETGGERYPISEVWALFGVLLRSPQGFEAMRKVLSLGPHGVRLMSRRTIDRRTRVLREEYAGRLLFVDQIPELIRAVREQYGVAADVDMDCNLLIDITSTAPDGMAVAGKPNHGFIVVLLCFHDRRIPPFPIHVHVTETSKWTCRGRRWRH